MEQSLKFEVFLRGPKGSSEEDRERAKRVPAKELPLLSAQAKEAARVLRMSDEDMQRFILTGKFAEERLRSRAHRLGEIVESILSAVQDHHVRAVTSEVDKPRWIVRVRAPEGDVNVAVPFELGNDVVDSEAIQDLEQLRVLLLENLAIGREFIGRRH